MLQPTYATVHLQRPAGPSPDVAVAKEDQDKRSTKDVIDNHLGYFGERNLDGILSDYAPDAVMFTPEGPLRGVESIRGFFRAMLAEFGKPGATFKMKQAPRRWTTVSSSGRHRLPTTCMSWVRTRSSCKMADLSAIICGKITPKY